MVWPTFLLGGVLLGMIAVTIMNLLKVDVSLLYLIAISMSLVLIGTEIVLVSLSEIESRIGLIIYISITFIVSVVLIIFAFNKGGKFKKSDSRRAIEGFQSYNTLPNRRAPQRRHRARHTRRERR